MGSYACRLCGTHDKADGPQDLIPAPSPCQDPRRCRRLSPAYPVVSAGGGCRGGPNSEGAQDPLKDGFSWRGSSGLEQVLGELADEGLNRHLDGCLDL